MLLAMLLASPIASDAMIRASMAASQPPMDGRTAMEGDAFYVRRSQVVELGS